MKVQVIKQEIPAEISETGGAIIRIVNKETVELETSIDEAKDQLCVVGDKLLVKGQFVGLFKSMVKGIERDGNARTLGDFLTLYPVPTGEFDLERGWDPAVNGVRIRARLMNEMELDISKWEFEDVTPGRQPFTLESVQAGDVTGVVRLDSAVAVNGRNLPATADVRVEYAVPEAGLSGTVAPAKVVSNATRLDIAADALAALNVPANDGRRVELTVRGNFANAKIAGVLKYVAPPPPTLDVTGVIGDEGGPREHSGDIVSAAPAMFHGEGLHRLASMTWSDQAAHTGTIPAAERTANAAGTVLTVSQAGIDSIFDAGVSGTVTFVFKAPGATPSDPELATTFQCGAVDPE